MENLKRQAIATIEIIQLHPCMPQSVKQILTMTLMIWVNADESADTESAFNTALQRIQTTVKGYPVSCGEQSL